MATVCARSTVYPIKLDTFQLRNCGRLESIFWLQNATHWNTTIKHKLDEDDTTATAIAAGAATTATNA